MHAHMHPGYQNPDFISPADPVDTGLTVHSIQSLTGQPIAVMANYSQHYKGSESISGDYYTRFARMIEEMIDSGDNEPPFVGIMSQGTSGDLHWMDYSKPAKDMGLDEYAKALAGKQVRRSLRCELVVLERFPAGRSPGYQLYFQSRPQQDAR